MQRSSPMDTTTLDHYWAKADTITEHDSPWHTFVYHALDVCAVAAELWAASPRTRAAFATAFPAEPDPARRRAWVLYFIALHDLGKLHACFQCKAPDVLPLSWPRLAARPASGCSRFDHGLVGYALGRKLAPTMPGRRPRVCPHWRGWLGAVTGHHGEVFDDEHPRLNDTKTLLDGYADPDIEVQDQAARRDWLAQAASLFLEPQGIAADDSPPPCDDSARALLAGFCSLCDWIGSDSAHFPYRAPSEPAADYWQCRRQYIRDTGLLHRLGLLGESQPYPGLAALLRDGERPRGVQTLIDASHASRPGLTLIEAPTGSGKTEAALALAWQLLAAGEAETIVFALPTQATANAMLGRCVDFARHAFDDANLVLAHGHRDLNARFRALVERGTHSAADTQPPASVQCAHWLASSRKRVFLGQLGVCTIDQVLLSVLPVRHNFIRAFGLHRAVLIVDEIHAYDAYMQGLLDEVLRRQRATGGSAILLSATLPSRIRARLLDTWRDTPATATTTPAVYPALWRDDRTTPQSLPTTEQPPVRTVALELWRDPGLRPDATGIEALIEAARQGARVGVVMNLVDDAQWLAQQLRDRDAVPVDLFHARLRRCDRQDIEQRVLDRYGRDAAEDGGRILVATQVIEQSLDLDLDWLITQLCPVDLLFQRIGRLHRHQRARPTGFETPRCSVLAPPEGTEDYGLHQLIYGDARLLWRTERLIREQHEARFPAAYRDWIETVYDDRPQDDEPDAIYACHCGWRDAQRAANDKAIQLTRLNQTQFRDNDEPARALTRDGELGVDVLLLDHTGHTLEGEPLPATTDPAWEEARLLNTCPAPSSWKKTTLADCPYDEHGQVPLHMETIGPGRWRCPQSGLIYNTRLGLSRQPLD
ncbi:CRISPR-associated helicase/endonuclease Cas3 [Marichromatium sp. AB32]|nr:CRISPR-associated helicase/endonuclease Cas3 [Marichromatium sp. AB32]